MLYNLYRIALSSEQSYKWFIRDLSTVLEVVEYRILDHLGPQRSANFLWIKGFFNNAWFNFTRCFISHWPRGLAISTVVYCSARNCNIAQVYKIPRGFGKFVKNYMEMPVGPHLYENLSFLARFSAKSSKTIFWSIQFTLFSACIYVLAAYRTQDGV